MSEGAYHFTIGKYNCIVFDDGTLGAGGPDVFGLNCLFIESGDQKILIDTGGGDTFQPAAGHLVKNLEAAGIKRSDINRIIFTHGHTDHVAGAFDKNGKPVFPSARYLTTEKEWEYWAEPPGSNEVQNTLFSPARQNLFPVREKFDLVKDNAEILPGIKLAAAHGHTPGNVIVDISSAGKRLLCVGDLIHAQLEFTNPAYLAEFDVTPEQALKTRARVFSDIVKSGVFVFACHFPFPGLGYIKQNNGELTWQPV